ncbi:MAG: methylated-DNA--[protein]-cysteine S-methyltransferase [Anaerolineae bacterium]|nr:methylated-DNA--[protein]-cysteine S-methyltransferase [Gemmatimonadaceae bacterium]
MLNVQYAIAESPLGRLLVGATERGVCSVCLGDDDAELEQCLRLQYPGADVQRNDAAVAGHVEAILRYLRGQVRHANLELDVQGTAFQWRVWRELQAIPYGETRTYSAIADAIGRPKAVRAVANACARNRAALIIPCHRAVRIGGALGGYRWGIERKRTLLEREAARSG